MATLTLPLRYSALKNYFNQRWGRGDRACGTGGASGTGGAQYSVQLDVAVGKPTCRPNSFILKLRFFLVSIFDREAPYS